MKLDAFNLSTVSYRERPSATDSPMQLAAQGVNTPPVHLTPRQREVLSLLCEGLPNKLICRRLNISTGTVKIHIGCIMRELGVSSRLQAVVSAQRFGILGESVMSSRNRETADAPIITGMMTHTASATN